MNNSVNKIEVKICSPELTHDIILQIFTEAAIQGIDMSVDK